MEERTSAVEENTPKKSPKKQVHNLARAKAIDDHISHGEKNISLLETQLKHGELTEEQVLSVLIRIENTRLGAVDEIWQVVKDIVSNLKKQVLLGKADMGKLAIVLGILVDKAQLISGGPTARVAFSNNKQKMTPQQRMGTYKALTASRKKPGRPQGGEKS